MADMRDRLIELIHSYPCMSTAKDCFLESISDDLADYLLENGVIVPPCKVNDTVYEIQPIPKRVQAYTIISVKYNGRFWVFSWVLKDRKGHYGNVEGFDSYQLGKTVFLSYKEAEQALKERERQDAT